MAKKSVSDLAFEFDDFGDLGLTGFDEGDVFYEEEIEEQEEEVEEQEQEVEEDDETPDLAARVSSIEDTLKALPGMIGNAISSAMGKSNQKEEEEEEIPEELNGKQIVNILAKRMEKVVKNEVGNAMQVNEPALKEARVTAEFRQAAMKYGQPFTDRMISTARIVNGVEKAGGKISVDAAYNSIKHLPPDPKPGQGKVTKTGKQPVKVDADSKQSVGSVNPPLRPKFDSKKIKEVSDADYFQQSWNGSLASHAKRRR